MLKYILLNVIIIPIWTLYYQQAMYEKEFFFIDADERIFFLIIAGFTIYNLYKKSLKNFIIRTSVLTLALSICCYISWYLHLNNCPHMSDEHDVLPIVIVSIVIEIIIVSLTGYSIKYLLNKRKRK